MEQDGPCFGDATRIDVNEVEGIHIGVEHQVIVFLGQLGKLRTP